MNFNFNCTYLNQSNELIVGKKALDVIFGSCVSLLHPVYQTNIVVPKESLIRSVLERIEALHPSTLFASLGGSQVLCLFAGEVYYEVHDTDWKIEIISPNPTDEIHFKVIAEIINAIASRVLGLRELLVSDQNRNKILSDFGIAMTTPHLSEGGYFARFTFPGSRCVPLELSLHVVKQKLPPLMFDLYIPLKVFENGLGSISKNVFVLGSAQSAAPDSMTSVLDDIRHKIITYEPLECVHAPNRNRWLRYLIALMEGATAPNSKIGKTWLNEACRDRLIASHISGWATYKRASVQCAPFYLVLNALFEMPAGHPLSCDLTKELFHHALRLPGDARLLDWLKFLFHRQTKTALSLSSATYYPCASLCLLLKLFIPFLADDVKVCRHSLHPHLRAQFFVDTPYGRKPYFILIPIAQQLAAALPASTFFPLSRYQVEKGSDLHQIQEERIAADIATFFQNKQFEEAEARLLESALLEPQEVELLLHEIGAMPQKPLDFDVHLRAAFHWKNKNRALFIHHLSFALECQEQRVDFLRDWPENDPFDFANSSGLLRPLLALRLAWHQYALFGPQEPLAFCCRYIDAQGSSELIEELCLRLLEAVSAQEAWKAYRHLAFIPNLAKAVEKKHLDQMIALAQREENRTDFLPAVLHRMKEASAPKRAFDLARLAQALGADQQALFPVLIDYLEHFPSEREKALADFSGMKSRYQRHLLLENKRGTHELFSLLLQEGTASFSTQELAVIASHLFQTQDPLSPSEINQAEELYLILLDCLAKQNQGSLVLKALLLMVKEHFCTLDTLSRSFWDGLLQIGEQLDLQTDHKWKRLFILLALHLPIREKTAKWMQFLNEKTTELGEAQAAKIVSALNHPIWFYYFKAAAHLQKNDKDAAYVYLLSFLKEDRLDKNLLSPFEQLPCSFEETFERILSNCSNQKPLANLLYYQSHFVSLANLISHHAIAYKRYPDHQDIVKECIAAFSTLCDEKTAWSHYPSFYGIESIAQQIEALPFSCQAIQASQATRYVTAFTDRYLKVKPLMQAHILDWIESLEGETAKVALLLAETYQTHRSIPKPLEAWYKKLSYQVALHLSEVIVCRFLMDLNEQTPAVFALGWSSYLSNYEKASTQEDLFFCRFADANQRKDGVENILLASQRRLSDRQKAILNLLICDQEDAALFFDSPLLSQETLVECFHLFHAKKKGSFFFKTYLKMLLHRLTPLIDRESILEQMPADLIEENLETLERRLFEEFQIACASNNRLSDYCRFFLKKEVGKKALCSAPLFSLFLDCVNEVKPNDKKALMHRLQIEQGYARSTKIQQIDAFVRLCSESTKLVPTEISPWIVQMLADMVGTREFLAFERKIRLSFPLLYQKLIDHFMVRLENQLSDFSIANGCAIHPKKALFCSSLALTAPHDLATIALYLNEQLSPVSSRAFIISSYRLFQLAVCNREMETAWLILKRLALSRKEQNSISSQDATLFLAFFNPEHFPPLVWRDLDLENFFLCVSEKYLQLSHNLLDPIVVEQILMVIEMKNTSDCFGSREFAIAIDCVKRLDCRIEWKLSRLIKTIGAFDQLLDPLFEKKLALLNPFLVPVLLRKVPLDSSCDERIRDLLSIFSQEQLHLSYETENFIKQTLTPIFFYVEAKTTLSPLSQQILQFLILIAYKCGYSQQIREGVLFLYRQPIELDEAHMHFLCSCKLSLSLFLDAEIYSLFLQQAERCFPLVSMRVGRQIFDLLIKIREFPSINQEGDQTSSLTLTLASKYAAFLLTDQPKAFVSLTRDSTPRQPIETIARHMSQMAAFSDGEEDQLSEFYEHLIHLRSVFPFLSLEAKLSIGKALPLWASYLFKIALKPAEQQKLVDSSKCLISLADFFCNLPLTRELCERIHLARIKKGCSDPAFQFVQKDIEHYVLFLNTFFNREFYGIAGEGFNEKKIDNLWMDCLKKTNKSCPENYEVFCHLFVRSTHQFILSASLHPQLSEFVFSAASLLLGYPVSSSENRSAIALPIPIGIEKNAEFFETFYYYLYTHAKTSRRFQQLTSFFKSKNENFLSTVIDCGLKRTENPTYLLAMALMGIKSRVDRQQGPLSPADKSTILNWIDQAQSLCDNRNFAFNFLLESIEKLYKKYAISELIPLFNQIAERGRREIAAMNSPFVEEQVEPVFKFIAIVYAACPAYSSEETKFSLPKETIRNPFFVLMRYDSAIRDRLAIYLTNTLEAPLNENFLNDLDAMATDFFAQTTPAVPIVCPVPLRSLNPISSLNLRPYHFEYE